MIYLNIFNDLNDYETYKSNLLTPNVTLIKNGRTIRYMKKIVSDPRLICKFNVEDISQDTYILYPDMSDSLDNYVTEIEIDGIIQQNLTQTYRFNTLGEHTVKYTLKDPTKIKESTFRECTNMVSVIIPNSVTTLEFGCFEYCWSLSEITIPNTCINWEGAVFESCSFTSFNIPIGMTTIPAACFMSTSLTSIIIPEGVTTIESEAFSMTNLQSISFPSTLTFVDSLVFEYSNNINDITCLATTAPTIYSQGRMSETGVLHVPTGSDYSSWISELGEGWTIDYI